MIKSSAKPVAPVNCVTLFDRPNYKTQSKTKYKSPSTRRRDQQRFDAFLLKKGTQVATQVPGTKKTEQEQWSVKRVLMCNAHTITDPVGTKSQLTQTDTGKEKDVEDKLKETLEKHFQTKSELDFNKEIKQMNFALKDELRLLEKDKSAQIEKLQRDLTSLQSECDNLRADVDRLRFERNESLDREEVLNLKILTMDIMVGEEIIKENNTLIQ